MEVPLAAALPGGTCEEEWSVVVLAEVVGVSANVDMGCCCKVVAADTVNATNTDTGCCRRETATVAGRQRRTKNRCNTMDRHDDDDDMVEYIIRIF